MGTRPLARTDVELVTAALAGDIDAFSDLYHGHVGAVRRVAFQVVGDADTANDVVQDTFARALQHLPALRDPDRFRAWLLSIARHAATDHLRARRHVSQMDEEEDDFASPDPGPESLAELKELAEQVQGCLDGLSHRDATAVAMVTHLGFTPTQVASALGVTPGAAKVLVHRARRRLRHALTLQLMQRQPSLACEEFAALIADDALAASKHLENCSRCIDATAREVVPFQFSSPEAPASPT